jgi:hypothetical protein
MIAFAKQTVAANFAAEFACGLEMERFRAWSGPL